MIIASKCGRFWALHILVQCAFRYFSCGKRNEIFRLRKVVLKLTALVPSTLQRCRSNRDFGAVVRAEISSVLSRMKSQQSLEISAGSGCSAARKKKTVTAVCLRHPRFFRSLATCEPAAFSARCGRTRAQSPF